MRAEELLVIQSSSFTALEVLALLPRTELIEYLQEISTFQCNLIQIILEGKDVNLDELEKYVDKFSEISKEAQTILSTNHIFKGRSQ
jgi:hypothetical protein